MPEQMTSNGAPLVIYGASDDLIEMDGGVREEWYALGDDTGTLEIAHDGTTLLVVVAYGGRGSWSLTPLGAVAHDGESVTVPWPMRLIDHTDPAARAVKVPTYSLALVVDAPAGATVSYLGDDEDEDDA